MESIVMDVMHCTYDIDGDDFTSAGEASGKMKRVLRKIGVDFEIIRRCAICMYEGEINMVIHANGGTADVYVDVDSVKIELKDNGPGIPNLDLAMQEGYSTASEEVRNLGFGAGMGLPNMKRYSDEITIATRLGEGTTVTMMVNFNEKVRRGSFESCGNS
jgi:anti-sigma regulatory factor (Ser/Thr protein kinase)